MRLYNAISIPHPFPYQGSKRGIASQILPYFPNDIHRLIEPFCGTAAVSIAAAARGIAKEFWLNDLNKPLMALWQEILFRPRELSENYRTLWNDQYPDKKAFFFRVRDEFNRSHKQHHLLYLLARIVKGSVRYSCDGKFNQSADNRRAGMHPKTMRLQILGVSSLLSGRTTLSAEDFRVVIARADVKDVVYMDPPYQGTSFTRDHRYYNGVSYEEFVSALIDLNDKGISYIISYDGRTGEKTHGKKLPESLDVHHIHVPAGKSSQATLLGRVDTTVESLYLSPALVDRLERQKHGNEERHFQQALAFI